MTEVEVTKSENRFNYFLKFILPFFVIASIFGLFSLYWLTTFSLLPETQIIGVAANGAMISERAPSPFIRAVMFVTMFAGSLSVLVLLGLSFYRSWRLYKNLPDDCLIKSFAVAILTVALCCFFGSFKNSLREKHCGSAGCLPVEIR